jgi:PadR family transcriptional regulator, regulatory protein AphA
MDVKTVCLGMLSDGEATGYDLKKQFESSFGHFFAAGYGSIYPALSSLYTDGLVECRQVTQDGRPDRKIYRITEQGLLRLRAALDNPNPSHKIRSDFLATMCFAHLMSAKQIDLVLENRLLELERYVDMFDELDACNEGWTEGERFVCGFGRAVTEAAKTFIEKHRDALTKPGHRTLPADRAGKEQPEDVTG